MPAIAIHEHDVHYLAQFNHVPVLLLLPGPFPKSAQIRRISYQLVKGQHAVKGNRCHCLVVIVLYWALPYSSHELDGTIP